MKYWINTVSRDHVRLGKQRGIIQAGHGKKAPLLKLSPVIMLFFIHPKLP